MVIRADIMNEAEVSRALKRIAHQILERNQGAENLTLLGICRGGLPLAAILAGHIHAIEGLLVPAYPLDITQFRDDRMQKSIPTEITKPVAAATTPVPASAITGKNVVLVDDVLYTGRTVRAAMDAVSAYGRASTIQLAVLIDRGHRELPIRADYVGKNVPTAKAERIDVHFAQTGNAICVRLLGPELTGDEPASRPDV